MRMVLVALWLTDIGRGAREALFMFWETLWALVLGFSLSGAVQSFVSKRSLQRQLGNHRPLAVLRASGYGMASSSCSYAASAMAKALFQKGADLVTAAIFMVASTNLVIELGIVMLVLLGWQFTAGEFVGGPIMILFLALFGGLVLPRRLAAQARRRLVGRGDNGAEATGDASAPQQEPKRLSAKLATRAGWADAAGFAFADLMMIRRELVVGYMLGGFAAVLVPSSWWASLFVHGHGPWTALENAAVGPVIASISCLCSIGNVPLAAALWRGGISFGGVISFIFADLLATPLILIYARYYGWRVTARLVGLLYLAMVAAALAVQGIFRIASVLPHVATHRPIVPEHVAWNATTVLNIVACLGAGFLYWLYRHGRAPGGDAELVRDPVCGMQIDRRDAPARFSAPAETFYFCSERCRDRFLAQRRPDHAPS